LDSSHFIAFKLKERLFSDLLNSTEIDDVQSKKIKKDLEIFQCDYLNYSSSVNIAQSLITKSLDSIVKETTIKFENLNNCDTNNPQTDSDVDLIDEDVSSLAYLSTQIKSEPRPVKERDSSGRILHRCDTCSKAFPTRAILVNHVRGIHTNIRPFKCETCGKCFPYKVTLESHRKRIHMGIRPFKCDTCEKTFFSRSNFVIHQRVHTKEKPYACEECGQGFSHLATLISHGRIHTGERPFACESCGKSFSDRSNLKTHAKIHEKENPFKCKECTKGFSSQNNLDEHAKSHLFE
jgi:DNA-directed RNA polymerase subunit RPC12/RpoP